MNRARVVNKVPSDLINSLGLSNADFVLWEVRRSLTKKIITIIESKNLSVTQIAKEAGTLRGRVTKILKNDTYGISLDVLFRVLGAIGQKVKLSYKKAA